jgi:hypothetical protein
MRAHVRHAATAVIRPAANPGPSVCRGAERIGRWNMGLLTSALGLGAVGMRDGQGDDRCRQQRPEDESVQSAPIDSALLQLALTSRKCLALLALQ